MNIADWTGDLIHSYFKIHWDVEKEKHAGAKICTSSISTLSSFHFWKGSQ